MSLNNSSQKQIVKVRQVEISTSVIGQKNIGIALSDSIKISDIGNYSEILTHTQEF